MVKKNTKKINKKEPVKGVVVPEVEDVNIGDTVEVDLTLKDKNAIVEINKSEESVVETGDIQTNLTRGDENINAVVNRMSANDMNSLTFVELYGMKQCIDTLNQHYLNVREMNFNYDAASYNDARAKLNKLKIYETSLYKIMENKIFDIEL